MEKRIKAQKQCDYCAFFVIGIALFTIGLATKNIAFGAAGLAMYVLGLGYKDKMEEKTPNKYCTNGGDMNGR